MPSFLNAFRGALLGSTALLCSVSAHAQLGQLPPGVGHGVGQAQSYSERNSPNGYAGTDANGNISDQKTIATGGSISRKLSDRASDQTNLREFGSAIGDGSDSSTALTAAMASTNSPTVLISSGVYGINPASYPAGSNVNLQGMGRGVTVLRLPASCSITSGGLLLNWISRSNVTVRDLTIDLNGCSTTVAATALEFLIGSQVHVERVGIVNAGNGPWLELYADAVSHFWAENNYLHRIAGASYQNQAINVSAANGTGDDLHVNNNTLVNTGAIINASHLEFCGNNVSGWGYGAGVSTNPTLSPDATLCNNIIHDSMTAQDSDGAWPNGMELWGLRTHAYGNQISNVASNGMFIGGPNSEITSNRVVGAGKRSDGAGAVAYQIGYYSTSQNGNGSTLIGNKSIDDGSGTTTYGLADASGVTGVYAPIGGNDFSGARGATSVVAGTSTGAGTTDNRVGNPCFAVDQRLEGASVQPGVAYTVDRWKAISADAGFTYQRAARAIGGCNTALAVSVTTQQTSSPSAGFFQVVQTAIESQDLVDLGYGGSNPKSLRLDFTVNFPVAGTYAVSLQNATGPRTYVATYVVRSAGVDQPVSLTIPGDGYPFPSTASSAGLTVSFDLGSGSNYATSAPNAWASGNFLTAPGVVRAQASASGSMFYISAVRLFAGQVDTPWQQRSYGEELSRAQRYFQKTFPSGTKPAQNAGQAGAVTMISQVTGAATATMIRLPVQMRATPTPTLFSSGAASTNCYDVTRSSDVGGASLASLSAASAALVCAANASAQVGDVLAAHMTLDADF